MNIFFVLSLLFCASITGPLAATEQDVLDLVAAIDTSGDGYGDGQFRLVSGFYMYGGDDVYTLLKRNPALLNLKLKTGQHVFVYAVVRAQNLASTRHPLARDALNVVLNFISVALSRGGLVLDRFVAKSLIPDWLRSLNYTECVVTENIQSCFRDERYSVLNDVYSQAVLYLPESYSPGSILSLCMSAIDKDLGLEDEKSMSELRIVWMAIVVLMPPRALAPVATG